MQRDDDGADAMAVMAEVDRRCRERAAPIWPGFRPEQVPVALYDGARTLLFRHPDPPPGFAPLDPPAGSEARVAVWTYAGLHPSVRANSSVDLGGIRTATVMLLDSADRTPAQLAATVVHEAFHVFQQAHHPDWSVNELDLLVYPLDDAILLSRRRLEVEALRRALDALRTDTLAGAAGWSQAALALRRERFAAMPPAAVAAERGTELHEGLARYVEQKVSGDDADHGLPLHGFPADAVRWSWYATGRALAVLLDCFAPGWAERLEAGEDWFLDELLDEAVSQSGQIDQPVTEHTTFSAAERAAALERAQADVRQLAEEQAIRRREFLARPGWRVVVQASASRPLWLQGFDPMNLRRLSGHELLHMRWLKLGNAAGALELLGGQALTEPAGSHPLAGGVRRVIVAGIEGEPAIEQTEDGITLHAGPLTAQFREGTIERAAVPEATVTLALP